MPDSAKPLVVSVPEPRTLELIFTPPALAALRRKYRIHETTADALEALIATGAIAGGMIPKVTSCIHAVRNGVHRAHILDGRVPHVLLLEIFTDEGIGTMVVPDDPDNQANEDEGDEA